MMDTSSRGWILKSSRIWDGKTQDIEIEFTGEADTNYATCMDTRRNVYVIVVMENTMIAVKSTMQKVVALSTTEAETIVIIQCVQELLYVMKLIESLKLKVRKPMIVYTDNKGAVDLINEWIIGGGTKNLDCRIMFLR